ncbi:MAG: hypothetical protein AMXMBFR84_27970 [Candidatus Hydrogenedentota bacterium]
MQSRLENQSAAPESPLLRGPRLRRIGMIVAALSVVGIASLAILAQKPIRFIAGGGLHLPAPDGPFAVGRTTWDVVDMDRPELFTVDEADHREIRVDVYYPAVATDAEPGPYLDSVIASGVTGVPAIATDIISPNWVANAKPDPSGAPYPVLVFSPGIDGPPVFYTSLLEHLTSRGYVILALWHPYTTSRTLFADGRIVESSFEGYGAMWEGEEATRDKAKQEVSRVWAEDAVTAIDEATKRASEDGPLKGLFDFARLGAFGHSFGGQNAAAAMTLDSRIRAGLNMDGTSVFQPILDQGVTGGFALVSDKSEPPPPEYLAERGITLSEYWANWDERNCPAAVRENASTFYSFQVDGLEHMGFSVDLALFQPLYPFVITQDMVGSVSGMTLLALLTDLVGGFFDEQLSGKVVPLLRDPSSKYPMLHSGINTHPPWEASSK